jgi:hypothetical protein
MRILFRLQISSPASLRKDWPANRCRHCQSLLHEIRREKGDGPRESKEAGVTNAVDDVALFSQSGRRSLLSELLGKAPTLSNHLISGEGFAFSRFDASDSLLKNGQKSRIVLIKA